MRFPPRSVLFLCALLLSAGAWFTTTAQAQTSPTTFGLGWIIPYITLAPPADCLPLNGTTHPRTAYPELYAAVDTAFIVNPDNFRVPDIRGRAPIGAGTGTSLSARAVNEAGGTETHVLTVTEMPNHVHDTAGSGVQFAQVNLVASGTLSYLLPQFPAGFELVTGAAGGSQAHNNMMPFVAINYCVMAKGIVLPSGGGSVGVPGDPVVTSDIDGQTVAFDHTVTTGDVQTSNLLTLNLFSVWAFFLFGVFVPARKK
jgi:microcystin-dependent protein